MVVLLADPIHPLAASQRRTDQIHVSIREKKTIGRAPPLSSCSGQPRRERADHAGAPCSDSLPDGDERAECAPVITVRSPVTTASGCWEKGRGNAHDHAETPADARVTRRLRAVVGGGQRCRNATPRTGRAECRKVGGL